LHHELNDKISKIQEKFETSSELNRIFFEEEKSELGLVASGVPCANALDILKAWGMRIPVMKIDTPYPLPERRVAKFIKRFKKVLILEDQALQKGIDPRGDRLYNRNANPG